MRKIIILVLLICFNLFEVIAQDFVGYKNLRNPLNDDGIVGKRIKNESFDGSTTSYTIIPGYQTLSSVDTNAVKAKIEADVSKVVSGKIKLENTKGSVSNFSDIEFVNCLDYSNIRLLGKGEYIISAIAVGAFDIKLTKSFDASLEAELDKEIAKNFNIKPEIIYSGNTAKIKLGGRLIVAVKTLKVTKDKYFTETHSIQNDMRVEYYDELIKSDNAIKFENMLLMEATTYTNEAQINGNKGCFYIRFINSTIGNPYGNVITLCPNCVEMKSFIKPNCDTYEPFAIHQNLSMIPILSGTKPEYIVQYSMSVKDVSIYYNRGQNNDRLSNFRVEKGSATFIIRKNVYYYTISK
ncbi:MAG: hypothetical protein JNJ40_12845 [Bacteroidia bacterium]|nr:hypothetical protein [Bacteroidia bacterium]